MVYDVAISNDDATALSTGEDGSLRVWDVKTGKQRRLIAAHQLPTETVCLTPDGRHAVTGCIDGTVKVWDIRTGKETSRLRPKNPADQFLPTRTVVLADGLRAVTGCDKGWIYLWELKTGREIWKRSGMRRVNDLAISPDGRHILASGFRFYLVEAATGKLVQTASLNMAVETIAYSPKGDYFVATQDNDRHPVVSWWDAKSLTRRREFKGHTGSIFRVRYALDNEHVLTVSADNSARLWRTPAAAPPGEKLRFLGHTQDVKALGFTPDGKRAISAGGDSTIRYWDVASGDELKIFKVRGRCSAFAVTADGRRLVFCSPHKSSRLPNLQVWDLETGKILKTK